MAVNTGDNRWATSNFIVAPTIAEGAGYTTIASAITAASAGNTIFIKPGTYTEDLTLKIGVSLTAFSADGDEPNVTIIGKATATGAGRYSISNVRLQTNSDFFLVVSGSAASIVNLEYCYLNCSNNTGISFTSSSASAKINISHCLGDLGTTGIGLWTSSSAGNIVCEYSSFTNSGGSSTVTTNSAGNVFLRYSSFRSPFSTTSTGLVVNDYSNIDTSVQNATALTTAGNGTNVSIGGFYGSGTASAVSIGAGTLFESSCDTINSTNTNAVTGAGTWEAAAVSYQNSSSLNNVSTVTLRTLYGGQIRGRITNTAPAAGMIGEEIRSVLSFASATSLTTATAKTLTSISLTPGIWDVSAIGVFVVLTATSTTAQVVSISTTDNTLASANGDDTINNNYTTAILGFGPAMCIPSLRVSVAATTTYYLVVRSTFTVSTVTAYGRISATRVA